MVGERIVNPSPQLWGEQVSQWLKLSTASTLQPSVYPSPDDDPEPSPAAPAARAWPRVFPGL